MNNRKKITGALYLMGQPLLLNALSIPAMAYIIRTLGAPSYGQWAVATSLVTLTSFLTTLGLRPLFVRTIAQDTSEASHALAEQIALRGMLAGGAALISLVVCFALHYPATILQCVAIAALAQVITTLAGTFGDFLQGLEKFQTFSAVSLIAGLVLTVASVVAVSLGTGPVGLSFAYLLGPIVNLAMFVGFTQKHCFPVQIHWNFGRFRELLRESRALAAQQSLSMLLARLDTLIVPKLVGVTEFGYFSAGTLLSSRLGYIPDGLTTAFYPSLARSARDRAENATEPLSRLIILSLVAFIPIAVLVSFLSVPIAEILFPGKAEVCSEVIRITVWMVPLLGLFHPMNSAMQAAGHHRESARSNMGASLCSAIISLFLIGRWGIMGACWAWLVRGTLGIIVLLPWFLRVFPTVPLRIPLGRILLCGLAMSALLQIFANTKMSPAFIFGLGGGTATVSYILTLLLLRVVSPSELVQVFRRNKSAYQK
jgi:O-antigen/teichoic acid export membrane protein